MHDCAPYYGGMLKRMYIQVSTGILYYNRRSDSHTDQFLIGEV